MHYETETIETRTLRNGLIVRLDVTPIPDERPNDVFGIWSRADAHEAGRTVQDTVGNSGYWVSCNYTPAELTRDYAKQGRENPSREAYDSLQRELHHYLYGNQYVAEMSVYVLSRCLATDSIGFDYSEWDALPGETVADRARAIARDSFDAARLVRIARREACKLADIYRHVCHA